MSMEVIEHNEVGSGGAASITFSSIPATYTDLYLVVCARSTRTAGELDDLKIKLNTSSSGFTSKAMYATNTTALSGTSTNRLGWLPANGGATANAFGNAGCHIPNYTSSNAKILSADTVTETNHTSGIDVLNAISLLLWDPSPNTAINEIEIYALNGNLVQYSSATLFGITAGSDGTTTVS